MKTISRDEQRAVVCKSENMWGVCVFGFTDDSTFGKDKYIIDFIGVELAKVVSPIKNIDIHHALICEDMMLFDTEVEARKIYRIFEKPPVYASVVYAALYSPVDGGITENT